MKDLIQYRLTDKPRFFLLRDVPEKPIYLKDNPELQTYDWKLNKYNEAFKLCESKALEIVNPEVLPNIQQHNNGFWFFTDSIGDLIINETFKVPEDVEFKEIEVDTVEDGGGCYVAGSKTMIRLSKKEEKDLIKCLQDYLDNTSPEDFRKIEPVKEESQNEINEMIAKIHDDIEGRYELDSYDKGIIHNLLCTIQRKHNGIK